MVRVRVFTCGFSEHCHQSSTYVVTVTSNYKVFLRALHKIKDTIIAQRHLKPKLECDREIREGKLVTSNM